MQQAARDEDFGESIGERELDVGISLVVAQQNVEARLALLDQIVFKRERFMLVCDENVFNVNRLRASASSVLALACVKPQADTTVRANARLLALPTYMTSPSGVLVEIHAGLRGQRADFFVQIHVGFALRGRVRASI